MKLFSANDLSYAYDGAAPVLKHLDFTLPTGDNIAILGANGCGKSTLLQILAGLRFASSGQLAYQDNVLDEKFLADKTSRSNFRREVGIVFQNPDTMFFQQTVLEEILYGPAQFEQPDIAMQTAQHWMGIMGLSHQAEEPPYLLSGGEKKKLALACTLASSPSTLLLDEPTANLDAATCDLVIDYLKTWQSNPANTLLVATHDLDLVRDLCSTCLVITPCHRQAAYGPTEQTLADPEFLVQMNLLSRRATKLVG